MFKALLVIILDLTLLMHLLTPQEPLKFSGLHSSWKSYLDLIFFYES